MKQLFQNSHMRVSALVHGQVSVSQMNIPWKVTRKLKVSLKFSEQVEKHSPRGVIGNDKNEQAESADTEQVSSLLRVSMPKWLRIKAHFLKTNFY